MNFKPQYKKIFRDLPEGSFQIIMNEIVANHRNVLMLAALGAFAGLRPSECCNVRRADSALGAGIMFETVDGEVTNVLIDLTEEKISGQTLSALAGSKRTCSKGIPCLYRSFHELL